MRNVASKQIRNLIASSSKGNFFILQFWKNCLGNFYWNVCPYCEVLLINSLNRANQVKKIWSSGVFFHFLCKHNAVNCGAMLFTPAQKQARVTVLRVPYKNVPRATQGVTVWCDRWGILFLCGNALRIISNGFWWLSYVPNIITVPMIKKTSEKWIRRSGFLHYRPR